MKVLHIGWCFKPWKEGGVIEYSEDLMNIQSDNGWDVSYFFSGRYYPIIKTKLNKWKNGKISMFEIINPPIFHAGNSGTAYPEMDIEEKKAENIFREVLYIVKPNIIHIHALAGLPSSLIDIIKDEYNIPLVITLHDYFLLCPTLKLFKYDHKNCLETKIGKECDVCCRNAPLDSRFLLYSTFVYILNKYHLYKMVQKFYYIFKNIPFPKTGKFKSNLELNPVQIRKEKTSLYQKRRDININRLLKADLLIAQSHKVEKIYKNFLKSNNFLTLHSTVKHLELIMPKKINVKYPIKFGILNGCNSFQKGSQLIFKVIKLLNKNKLNDLLEFHIYGDFDVQINEILNYENVYYHGTYNVNQLDEILNEIDVGIVPSVWEEVYGYVGIEFLTKGIPVIGNKKGGITDYTIDNSTGWVNKTASSEELVVIICNIIKNPEKITKLNRKIIANKKLVKSMDTHFNEIKNIYLNLTKKGDINV